jgi:RNA-directed DNA polymerase
MGLFPAYSGPSLMEQVCAVPNLTQAWQKVRANIQVERRRRSAGVDAVTLSDFEADWSGQMLLLQEELRSGTYRPLPARRVSIPKRSGGERALSILAVRDRIAQRAVQQVLDPVFDPLFLDCSYGCRPRVGVHDALSRVERYAAQGFTWVVDADIASYYDTIDQRILLGLVRQRIQELPLLQLLALWLEAGTLQANTNAPQPTGGSRLLDRGRQVVRQMLAANESPPPPPQPYGVWEQAGPGPLPASPWMPLARPPLDQRLWTMLSLAQPVMDGVRYALPYVRQAGGQRLLIAGALAAGTLAAGEVVLRRLADDARGTMQGGAVSPLLANIYLHPFDVALSSQGLRLVRFVDDFVIMCASQAEAERALELARRQLATLRLELNAEKSRVVAYADGLDFLGRALLPRQRGPRLVDGISSFEQAEQALRSAAAHARRPFRRRKDST